MPRIADEERIGCMILMSRGEMVLEHLIKLGYNTLSNVLYLPFSFLKILNFLKHFYSLKIFAPNQFISFLI